MIIKELGDYTMYLVGENGIPWFHMVSIPYNFIRMHRAPKAFCVSIPTQPLVDCSEDYLQTKDELILYFKDKISDKYTVNEHVNVSII